MSMRHVRGFVAGLGKGLRRSRPGLVLAAPRRTVRKYGLNLRRLAAPLDERSVFVVGSPRSGTSFMAEAIGSVPGFADLGEVNELKAALPRLFAQAPEIAAPKLRMLLRRTQRLGMVASLRAIEQTPESTFVIAALARAFPRARFVHMVRDGRDVACSLLERGWLRTDGPAGEGGADDAGKPFGEHARFWVEAERAAEFSSVSEAQRAGWVWRRYETSARTALAQLAPGRSIEVRYEDLAHAPGDTALRIADALDATSEAEAFVAALSDAHASSIGRYRKQLTAEQLTDVEHEAGALLEELGYPLSAAANKV